MPNLSSQGDVEIKGNTVGRVANKGMEGLAITPDGKTLVGGMQSPLAQDGGDIAGGITRIVTIDIKTGRTHEYAYQLDTAGKKTTISEILAVNDHEFLVIERDEKAGEEAKIKRVVKIDIAGASDISGVASLPATGAPEGVKPVTKKPVIDILRPKYGLNDERMPAKIEGLAFGPDTKDGQQVLMITSDNDAKVDESTWVWIFGLDAKELPGFVAQKFGK